jgi:uridine monophosphate synthetase
MKGFFSRLENRVRQVDSLLCVGLDPHPLELNAPTPEAACDFCFRLIESTQDLAAAYKPNAAFFEAFGPPGFEILKQVIAGVPDGIPVILDAKRGDIASTAQAYARAVFQALGADAVTINPYLGYDALEPFLNAPERAVFLLCKTSNPGAADLQDLNLADGRRLYEHVARLANEWNRADNLGLVVGATQPDALQQVRRIAPDLWILAPGVGAQGGDLGEALRAGLRPDRMGLLVPVSRGISRAEEPHQAAKALRDAINQVRREVESQGGHPGPAAHDSLQGSIHIADELLEYGCIQFGRFTLKSGLQSPIYIDLRRLAGNPGLLAQVADAYRSLLVGLRFDHLAAIPYAAIPIATAISLASGWPLIYPRKEAKEYGTRAEVEGVYHPGEIAVVIDDLTTTGGSKFETIEKLTSNGLQVRDVVVLIDRQSGAAETLAQAGYRLHAVFTLAEMLDHWAQTNRVPADQISAVRQFLSQVD